MNFVPMPAEAATGEITEDAVLGARLRLRQPRRGHRVGHDAILLAAACPARGGDHVVDLGAGIGAAGLALAARVDGVKVTLVEVDRRLAALAAENAQRNGLAARVSVTILDATAPARAYTAAGLAPESVARVLMNPPFNDPARHRMSAHPQRRLAHSAPSGTLAIWVRSAARLLRPRGTLSLVWRAEGLDEVMLALDRGFGAVAVLPVHPAPQASAVRILVCASKASRAPLTLLPGLVLTDGVGNPTEAAQSVLRAGAPLAQFEG
jgi:tRNA1(Val) A37 N6-methylase TrmN6